MSKKLLRLLIFFPVFFNSLSAQTGNAAGAGVMKSDSLKTYQYSDVIVTATRSITPQLEIASSVTVLNEKTLSERNNNSLADLLREVPGLSIARQGGPGTMARAFIRGASPRHTLVMIDGVPVNDPSSLDNSFDFSGLQTDNIERIEVLRGPQSTLYGSDAMAGVISIFTKKGEGSPKFKLSAEGGSYNTFRTNASVNGSNNLLEYSASFSRLNSGGFSAAGEKYGNREADGTLNNSLLARLGIKLSPVFSLDFNYDYIRSDADLDQNYKLGDDPNFTSETEQSVFRTALNTRLFDGKWLQTFSFSSLRYINHTTDDSDMVNHYSSIADFDGTKYKFEWLNHIMLDKNNTLTFGADHSVEKAATFYMSDQYGLYMTSFPAINQPEPEASITGLFLQDQFSFDTGLFGSLGVRYDKHNKFGSNFTFRIAPAYLVSVTNTKIKATFGTAFKSPSLFNLLDPFYGNPDLKPEKNSGWDAGFEQYFFSSRVVFGASYFSNKFTDLLGMDKNNKSVNIDKAETKGVELIITALLTAQLKVIANYTYTDSRDKSEGKINYGRELTRRPANVLSLNVNYTSGDFNMNAEYLSVGKRYDDYYDPEAWMSSRFTLSPYNVVNLAATYNLNRLVTLYGRISNLFNEQYEEVLYYGTPGRSAFAGIRLTF